jgi:spoIIIJ-associated protein
MREIERSAASVEEAVEAALAELGVTEQEAEVQIVQEPSRGLLGFGGQQAVVKVRAREEDLEEIDLDEQAEVAADFIEGLLDRMDLDAEVDIGEDDGVMYVDIFGAQDDEGMGILIGRHGLTLDALQELTRSAVQRKLQERCRVVIDVEDYRKRRRRQLVEKTRSVAQRVRRSGKPERMEPMSPFERKIVHDAAAEAGGVETSSEGEEPQRRVVIRKR